MERNSGDARRRDRERVMVQEGIELWKQKKSEQWTHKLQEQRELREMLAKYSPWGRPGCGAPNPDAIRKRKLHLQGLFAEEDKKNLGVALGDTGRRPAPSGTTHRVDPMLRFQFNEPARRCVDNVLRYRRDAQAQQAYRQELDALVSEKRREKAAASSREAARDQQLGWSDDTTLRCLQKQQGELRYQQRLKGGAGGDNPGGVELVPLLARRRAAAERHPLSTTDVTRVKNVNGPTNWRREAGANDYVRELAQQVFSKEQRVRQARQEDVESCRRHFETWQQFWGRPGHGAPREVKVKGNIDVLLHRLPVK
ncbi:uncharacterized protein [Periplaneta americana]|uniref:uncharacterized protein n=1 Tax=Periplaneta americana TaxID=6978 RepID=UPI0037E8D499